MTDHTERAALCAIVQKHLAVQTQEMENYGSFGSNPGVPKDNYGELAAAIAADIQAEREADLTEWLKRTELSNDVSEAERQLLESLKRGTPVPPGWKLVPVEPYAGSNYEAGLWSRRNWDAALEDQAAAPEGTPE